MLSESLPQRCRLRMQASGQKPAGVGSAGFYRIGEGA